MASPLTLQHRNQQLALRAVTLRELQRLWPALDPTRLDVTYPAWATAVARLTVQNRSISAALAAQYLRQFRTAANIPGAMPVSLANALAAEALAVSLRYASAVSIKRAVLHGATLDGAMSNAFVASAGVITRHILGGGRDTIVESLALDDRATGWSRVTSGGCDFCVMLEGRGAVYSASTADFASHDHCSCSAEPVYGEAKNVRSYSPSGRHRTQGDRDKLNKYLEDNPPEG